MKDVLLYIDSYPEATSQNAIDQAVGFVALFDGRLSALAVQVLLRAPYNALGSAMINLSELVSELQTRSANACKTASAYFEAEARARGVHEQTIVTQSSLAVVGDCVASHAKTRDVCIIPVAGEIDRQRDIIEAVIFGSGRPIIMFTPGSADLPQQGIGEIVLAWDNSRTAARAMAGALPLLMRARAVRILTIVNEKSSAPKGIGRDALRHLALHGVTAAIDEVDSGGKAIGAALDAYFERAPADLLVMGAFGKSRVREFIFGGATAHVLAGMKVPLFMAH